MKGILILFTIIILSKILECSYNCCCFINYFNIIVISHALFQIIIITIISPFWLMSMFIEAHCYPSSPFSLQGYILVRIQFCMICILYQSSPSITLLTPSAEFITLYKYFSLCYKIISECRCHILLINLFPVIINILSIKIFV